MVGAIQGLAVFAVVAVCIIAQLHLINAGNKNMKIENVSEKIRVPVFYIAVVSAIASTTALTAVLLEKIGG